MRHGRFVVESCLSTHCAADVLFTQDSLFMGHVMGGVTWTLQSNTTRAFNTSAKVGNGPSGSNSTSSGSNSASGTGTSATGRYVTALECARMPLTVTVQCMTVRLRQTRHQNLAPRLLHQLVFSSWAWQHWFRTCAQRSFS